MSNKLINKSTVKTDKKVAFKIEKDLSLNNIEQAKSELEEIISKNPNFHLELKNIDSFDLSSIQLLYAIKSKLKNDFSYTVEMKDELKTIFQHAGFDYILNM